MPNEWRCSEGWQRTLVCSVRRTATAHRRRLSASLIVQSFVDTTHGRRQRQLSVDDADAPWTASQPHSDELQPAGARPDLMRSV